MATLFHVCERNLSSGSIIKPGRWGANVLKGGRDHPFFFREHLLEIWRREKTSVKVSRFNCSFAFENQEQANQWTEKGEFVLSVVPADDFANKTRLDMLWITWMSEPGSTTDQIAQWCACYWAGKATTDIKPEATAAWEWLFSCPLVVV